MTYQEENTIGIVLNTVPYQEAHQIVTLFTLNFGLIKLFVNYAGKKNLQFLTPYNKVEILFRTGNAALDYFVEGKFIKKLPEISATKRGFDEVNTAHQMALSVLSMQHAKRSADKMYLLFEAYLTALPLISDPALLLRSFQLKSLIYEGVLSLDTSLEGYADEELKVLNTLALSRSITEIDACLLSEVLSLKIQMLFEEILR